ncbi:MAG: CBS domain-containing protein [Thermosynechococcaceae cyanobacterium MS004]|nr:CBS domain-containing protein [Thermosynechococcaceae cyanobacterium MS004]
MISQNHHQSCLLMEDATVAEHPSKDVRASCVLVMENQTLLGILTERDVVQLTANAINFAQVTVADVMTHPVIALPQQLVKDIFAALFLFRRYRIRHLPIVDEDGQLVGVLSHESIRQILNPVYLLRLRRVSEVMTTEVIQASPLSTLLSIAQLMAEHRVSCIVITQSDGEETNQPIGIVTERDMVQFQAFGIDLRNTLAQTVMSTPLFLLSPEDTLWIAHQEMQRRRVGRLVVSWNWGREIGIVTQTSLLRVFDPMEMYYIIESLQQTIQQLETKHSLTVHPTHPQPSPKSQRTRIPYFPKTSWHLEQGQAHENLVAFIEDIYREVIRRIDGQTLTIEQRRSLLSSLAPMLEKLGGQVNLNLEPLDLENLG